MENKYELLDEKLKGYIYITKLDRGDYGSFNFKIIFSDKKLYKQGKIVKKFKSSDLNKCITLFKMFLFQKNITNNELNINTYPEIIFNTVKYIKKNIKKIKVDINDNDNSLIYKNFYNFIYKIIKNKYMYNFNSDRFTHYMNDLNNIKNFYLKCYIIIKLYKTLIIKNNLDKKEIPFLNKFYKSFIDNNELDSNYIKNVNKIFNQDYVVIHF
jgi:hypothetical protein